MNLYYHHNPYNISCGYGNLWLLPVGTETPIKINAENVALELETDATFVEIKHPWKEGDTLLVSSFGSLYGKGDEERSYSDRLFRQMIIEQAIHSPQKIVEGILRRIRITSSKQVLEKAVTLIAVQR